MVESYCSHNCVYQCFKKKVEHVAIEFIRLIFSGSVVKLCQVPASGPYVVGSCATLRSASAFWYISSEDFSFSVQLSPVFGAEVCSCARTRAAASSFCLSVCTGLFGVASLYSVVVDGRPSRRMSRPVIVLLRMATASVPNLYGSKVKLRRCAGWTGIWSPDRGDTSPKTTVDV